MESNLQYNVKSKSRHDELRDVIAHDWQTALKTGCKPVLSLSCECGNTANNLPLDGVTVETEYTWRGKRPDIAILNDDKVPCYFGEVIDQGPPSKDLLATYQRASIPVVFIPYSDGRAMSGYCSVQCWEERRAMQKFVGVIHGGSIQDDKSEYCDADDRDSESLLWCEDCGIRLEEREAIGDCTGVACPKCVGANIINLCCWGRDPFNEGRWVDEDSTLAELLAYWNSTDFWRFVWEKRVREPGAPYGGTKDESLTTSALQFVSAAIASSQFRMAYSQLLDVGRSPMTAFESNNCQAVAWCWSQLESHAESKLPSDFEVTRRPDDWER